MNGLVILYGGVVAVPVQVESVKKLLPLEFTWLLPGKSDCFNLSLVTLEI